MIDFVGFPKIPRLNRDIIITEKIDGTNGHIYISEDGDITLNSGRVVPFLVGSRTRWIFPENDNMGFAKWCYYNETNLLGLGPGHHFGEWWGQKIQRAYGLKERRFSLFNVTRWEGKTPEGIYTVPVLFQGPFSQGAIEIALDNLKTSGSAAAPGFMKPEGVCVFHTAANMVFKVTCENDDKHKGQEGS